MATLRIKFLATSVQMQMHLLVFLPETALAGSPESDRPLKVLWLLHGEAGDCSDWSRLSMVEHYAEAANLALVMPNVDNSMYMDMAHGGYPYFTYLLDDLPCHVRHVVRVLSDRPQDNFVAGVAVGGYGALKWHLRAPQMFAAAACLSGDIDMISALRDKAESGTLTDDWMAAFGDPQRIAGTQDDTLHLLQQHAGQERRPAIFVFGNPRDSNFARNQRAIEGLRKQGVELALREIADEPNWPSWNVAIRDFIGSVVAPGSKVEERDGAR